MRRKFALLIIKHKKSVWRSLSVAFVLFQCWQEVQNGVPILQYSSFIGPLFFWGEFQFYNIWFWLLLFSKTLGKFPAKTKTKPTWPSVLSILSGLYRRSIPLFPLPCIFGWGLMSCLRHDASKKNSRIDLKNNSNVSPDANWLVWNQISWGFL